MSSMVKSYTVVQQIPFTTTSVSTTTKENTNNNNNNTTINKNGVKKENNKKSVSTCSHIDKYKREGGCKRYENIEGYIFSKKYKVLDQVYSSEFKTPYCMTCNCFNGRLHICLHCENVHVSCWKSGHIIQHFKDNQPSSPENVDNNSSFDGHFLAVDLELNQIYCYHCQDYIYDKEFDEIKESVKLNVTINVIDIKNPSTKRVKYRVWKPSDEESKFIRNNSEILDPTLNNPTIGLRGLNNLGNTCFMNSILQSFLHNPLLRNYFLSDMHKCDKKLNMLNNENSNSNNNNNNNNIKQEPLSSSPTNEDITNNNSEIVSTPPTTITSTTNGNCTITSNGLKVCLGCEMDKLFTCVFSGIRFPFTPHHFLYSCWNYSSYFVGYEQQDAHEFFISSLNGIHSHCGGTTGKDCDCIVHCTFGGSLKSEVSCLHCQFTSSTSDPFIDISLDIPKTLKHDKHNSKSENNKSISSENSNGRTAAVSATSSQEDELSLDSENGEVKKSLLNNNQKQKQQQQQQSLNNNTLLSCLERFTQPEKLDEKYFCPNCNCKQESTKQLSFDTLPVVICFHLKRFERSQTQRRTHKIDTFIEFPTSIDMGPYTTIMKKKEQLSKKLNSSNNKKRKAEVIDLEDENNNNDGNVIKEEGEKEKVKQETKQENDSTILNELNNREKFPTVIEQQEGDNSFIFELFAVVIHDGKIDSGHYTSFVKHQDSWYKCDDSMISSTTIHTVLKSKGYLLYYLKKQLEYTK